MTLFINSFDVLFAEITRQFQISRSFFSRFKTKLAVPLLGANVAAGAAGVAEVHRQGEPSAENQLELGWVSASAEREVSQLFQGNSYSRKRKFTPFLFFKVN